MVMLLWYRIWHDCEHQIMAWCQKGLCRYFCYWCVSWCRYSASFSFEPLMQKIPVVSDVMPVARQVVALLWRILVPSLSGHLDPEDTDTAVIWTGHPATQCCILEDWNLQWHWYENLKSHSQQLDCPL